MELKISSFLIRMYEVGGRKFVPTVAGSLTDTAQNRGTSSDALHDEGSERLWMKRIVTKISTFKNRETVGRRLAGCEVTSSGSLYVFTRIVAGGNADTVRSLHE